ncbi:MAG TPA: NAD-dependent epimerase/dehydratase family protein [Patescibacteria group bacterium]
MSQLLKNKNFWQNKKVLVCGGSGFIGSFVCELLLRQGANVTITTLSNNLTNIIHIKNKIRVIKADLRDITQTKKVTKKQEIVLNLASKVAGIQYNIGHPVEMFEDNIEIAKNVLKSSLENSVERFLVVSSACVYPRFAKIPTKEDQGFLDDPEPTNLGYGWAKRVTELLGRFYFEEYGFKVAIARPYNTYGPRDNFDPNLSHVIPGIIKRAFDNENPLIVWGSGKQTRSFIYVEDLAHGLLETVEKYPVADPVNIGSEEEINILNLTKIIVRLSGKKIKIKFDRTKPDGQPRRACDVSRAKRKIGFVSKISLEEGLVKTIEWYKHR